MRLLVMAFVFLVPSLLLTWFIYRSAFSANASAADPTEHDLFVSGTDGYHTFRIPSLILTPAGTALAFCEARKDSRSDAGDIDVVVKRSLDGGKTWGPMTLVADDGPHTIGNPCPVYVPETNTLVLLLTRNRGDDKESAIKSGTSRESRSVWITRSRDEGATWDKPVEITAQTKRTDWTWYATGPGVGIRMRSGRLVIPCDHAVAGTEMFRSHVILSDDGGETWRIGGVPGDHTNECQVVEREDGALVLNMRSYHGQNRRAVSISQDGGETWAEPVLDDTLIEPICQASLIRYSWAAEGASRVLFANPASTDRTKMTVRLSTDDCRTWSASKQLTPGPSAYSSLARMPDGKVGCLYEKGEKGPYERIVLAVFDVAELKVD